MGWDCEGRYWARIEEMKELVEPFPLVPAICIGFNRSKSDGFPLSDNDFW